AKVMLATGLIVTYGYLMEVFFGWYSASRYEHHLVFNERLKGPYSHTYYMLILCNCIMVQFLWSRRLRTNAAFLWIIAGIINIGMWLERYVIVVISLHADFPPSSWGMYHGTFWDYSTFYGSIGLFLTLLFLFVRFLPVISITEMRELVHEQREHRA